MVDLTERKKTEAQVRRMSIELTLAEERERKAIARELHDGLGQLPIRVTRGSNPSVALMTLNPAFGTQTGSPVSKMKSMPLRIGRRGMPRSLAVHLEPHCH